MIYLNNAGTTWPKPKEVSETMQLFQVSSPDQWNEVFYKGLDKVVEFFNVPEKDRFLFTTSCTSSLSTVFSDFPWQEGDRLIISQLEHHALSRWFFKLQNERAVEGVIIPRTPTTPFDLKQFEIELQKGARMVATTMACNVTGELLPYQDIVELSHKYGALCLLDGAQTAGVIPIDINDLKPDFFVFAGHKAPFGPQGIGGLYIDKAVSMVCPSAACEITPGERPSGIFPSYCDTGSANMMAIAGLTAGLSWLQHQGWDMLTNNRKELSLKLREGLQSISGLQVVGINDINLVTAAVSIVCGQYTSSELASKLWNEFRIKASAGFQCSPLAHEALGTDQHGTLRFSTGPMNRLDDIDHLLEALKYCVD